MTKNNEHTTSRQLRLNYEQWFIGFQKEKSFGIALLQCYAAALLAFTVAFFLRDSIMIDEIELTFF